MKLLNELIWGIRPNLLVLGDEHHKVAKLAFDSREVEADTLFFAVRGSQVDGHQYIDTAIAKGATIILCEAIPENRVEGVTYLQTLSRSSGECLGILAGAFYDNPSKSLKLVGITGTNGKTTTATLLFRLFMAMGYPTGLLSTVENKIGTKTIPATHTTPDAIQLQKLLRQMVEEGCEYAFMEVSSHALDQGRTAGTNFAGAVFTNITHDHLDYHKTFNEYIKAKKRLFDGLEKTAFALTNTDDKRGEVMLQNTHAKKYTYALRRMADFKAKIIENTLAGLWLDLNDNEFHGRLIGEFNAYNTLAVFATASLLQIPEKEILTALSGLESAEGRFEYIHSKEKNVIGIVDYAHTPDALEKVLKTVEELRGKGEIITVIGCGGDRDKTKRPEMAKIAADWSQHLILTSDNPRTEDPETILNEMETGVPIYATKKVLRIALREQAIKTACRLAKDGDIILLAGKGHEKYQDIMGVKYPFDDKEFLKQYLL